MKKAGRKSRMARSGPEALHRGRRDVLPHKAGEVIIYRAGRGQLWY